MNLKERLAIAEAKQRAAIERVNALEQERQQLLQEALKMEGEIRLLKELEAEEVKPEG